jgi:PST family polysaccharide transporter
MRLPFRTFVVQVFARSASQEAIQRILRNFLSLSALQALNYIFPLVTIPYLTRVLGPAKLGLFGFATSFVGYFNILTDYGFNLSATRAVAVERDDLRQVGRIYSAVMLIKACLCALSFGILVVLVASFDIFRRDAPVYLLAFGVVVGSVLSPGWLFQGMERMTPATYPTMVARTGVTIAIFLVVRSEEHLVRLVALYAAGTIGAGLVTLWLAHSHLHIRFTRPSLSDIRRQLVDGWFVFVSSLSIATYTISPTVVLGLLTTQTITGYYTAAEKVRQALQALFSPLFQAVYPYVASLAHESKERALHFLRLEFALVGSVGAVLSLGVLLAAGPLIHLLAGPRFVQSIPILRVLCLVPILVLLGNIFTVQGLLSFGLTRDYLKVYLTSSIFGLLAMFALTLRWSAMGTACSLIFIETFVVGLTLYRLGQHDIRLFPRRSRREETVDEAG